MMVMTPNLINGPKKGAENNQHKSKVIIFLFVFPLTHSRTKVGPFFKLALGLLLTPHQYLAIALFFSIHFHTSSSLLSSAQHRHP